MADVILKRTVFLEKTSEEGGVCRFEDFARVITPIGTMVEPFLPLQKLSINMVIGQYDNKEEMCRIDDIEYVDSNKLPAQLGDGLTPPLHGGWQMPRTGR
jgi:hypothetical protein